jgi:hypothetical protein
VREEALTLDATAERMRELVTRFRLERTAALPEMELPTPPEMFAL